MANEEDGEVDRMNYIFYSYNYLDAVYKLKLKLATAKDCTDSSQFQQNTGVCIMGYVL